MSRIVLSPMTTEVCIARLAADLRPTPPNAMSRRLGLGLALGCLAAVLLMLAALGLRPDLSDALGTPAFWLKWSFTLPLTWAGFLVVQRLGRPGGRVGWAWMGLILPLGLAAAAAFAELAASPPWLRPTIWFGGTALRCPIAIAALAAPVLLGLAWVFRRFAPTRLRLAGFAAGLLAGAAGAAVYALACPETSVAFMATWYTLGLLAAGALGAVAGPVAFRW